MGGWREGGPGAPAGSRHGIHRGSRPKLLLLFFRRALAKGMSRDSRRKGRGWGSSVAWVGGMAKLLPSGELRPGGELWCPVEGRARVPVSPCAGTLPVLHVQWGGSSSSRPLLPLPSTVAGAQQWLLRMTRQTQHYTCSPGVRTCRQQAWLPTCSSVTPGRSLTSPDPQRGHHTGAQLRPGPFLSCFPPWASIPLLHPLYHLGIEGGFAFRCYFIENTVGFFPLILEAEEWIFHFLKLCFAFVDLLWSLGTVILNRQSQPSLPHHSVWQAQQHVKQLWGAGTPPVIL